MVDAGRSLSTFTLLLVSLLVPFSLSWGFVPGGSLLHVARQSRTRSVLLAHAEGSSSSSSSSSLEYIDFLPNPNPGLGGPDVVATCMDTLMENRDAGLEVCFHFSSDRCRAAIGGSLDNFRSYAENPTFGFLIGCDSWKTESIGAIIHGTQHRGSMQTVLMSARTEEADEERRFLWTLQQERRPPLEGCFMIHEVLYVKNAFLQTV